MLIFAAAVDDVEQYYNQLLLSCYDLHFMVAISRGLNRNRELFSKLGTLSSLSSALSAASSSSADIEVDDGDDEKWIMKCER